jgi:hypothetical protein
VLVIQMRCVPMIGVLATLLTAPPAFAQAGGQASAPPRSDSSVTQGADRMPPPPDLPVSLERVREGLARPDLLRAQFGDDGRVVFRVEVEGRLPTFQSFIGEDEPLTGPTPFGSMTHSDFLQMVTPSTMRSYQAFTTGELLQVLATSYVSGAILNGAAAAVKGVRGMVRERRSKLAREEVRQVIAELERRQREAERKKQEDAGGAISDALPQKEPGPDDPGPGVSYFFLPLPAASACASSSVGA